MKIAVWKTGHEIADTVAEALREGFDAEIYRTEDCRRVNGSDCNAHIAYGILRGTDRVFKECGTGHWFNVDRGYLNPGHYDGYYRISHRGTQARWHEGIPRKPVDIKLEPWRTTGDYVLICPPTEAVCEFFDIGGNSCANRPQRWYLDNALNVGKYKLRTKDTPFSLEDDLSRAKAVITFNSSVGWKALQMGIPVLSDINHSLIGSHYGCTDLQTLTDKLSNMPDTRLEIFEAMAAHQFTLEEIKQGRAWPLISHYISGLDTTHGKPSLQMSAPTPFAAGLKHRFQSNT